MNALFTPMLYTSLTTAVGFASLALTPIPPVQVFGIFIAFGVLMAWLWTILFIPAFVMFIKEESLEGYGAVHASGEEARGSFLTRLLNRMGTKTYRYARLIIVGTVVLTVVAVYGISRIVINDNPTKWFAQGHPIREADAVLNEHFGGTYMAYLALEYQPDEEAVSSYAKALGERSEDRVDELKGMVDFVEEVFDTVASEATRSGKTAESRKDLLSSLESFAETKAKGAPDEKGEAWDEVLLFLDEEDQRTQVFKQPKALEYVTDLQQHLLTTGVVGKSNSLADIVKTVYRELISGEEKDFVIPGSSNAVAQCLITYQNSHRPQDLWHFVTPDYTKTVIWAQLKSGDNRDMSKVAEAIEKYISENPPPIPLRHEWFGLTYINVVWQQKMVSGMLQAFLGSFLCVFLMMTLLYKSALWGFLCMMPLTITIAFIYGVIGLIGKDYDMPVAVLSALSLGLAVDYAIHFLTRSRGLYEKHLSWGNTVGPVFGEPARAIARNVIVVGVGFLPLILAPLVPYQTVGIFISSILVVAGGATLLLLPSLLAVLERLAFPRTKVCCFACNCATCTISAAALVALVAVNVHQFFSVGYTKLTWLSGIAIVILAGVCFLSSRRDKCNVPLES
jgi:predicted RND superfamily exporter protein